MKRTAARPLATGQIQNPHWVLLIGGVMIFGASGLALAFGQPALAAWLFIGAVIYVGIYTIWLKPRTVLNIVIGGAAGSCAVISGAAAVGAWSSLPAWILASLIFVWTPVHFWALALAYRDDYVNASYPMLPARISAPAAARWTALHTYLTAGFALLLAFLPGFDPVYLGLISLVSIPLFTRTADLLRSPDKQTGIRLFIYTNIYLSVVLLMIILSLLWR